MSKECEGIGGNGGTESGSVWFEAVNDVKLFTVPEAAKELGISTTKCWEMVRAKELPSVRIGKGNVRIPRFMLRQWLEEQIRIQSGEPPETDPVN